MRLQLRNVENKSKISNIIPEAKNRENGVKGMIKNRRKFIFQKKYVV